LSKNCHIIYFDFLFRFYFFLPLSKNRKVYRLIANFASLLARKSETTCVRKAHRLRKSHRVVANTASLLVQKSHRYFVPLPFHFVGYLSFVNIFVFDIITLYFVVLIILKLSIQLSFLFSINIPFVNYRRL